MKRTQIPEDLRSIVSRYRRAFVTVGILSCLLNILVLGGSLYMMMVYDSVLPSHSLPTLFGLLALLMVVYAFQGVFDAMRTRILGNVGNSLDKALSARLQHVMVERALREGRLSGDGLGPMRDLEAVRSWLSGPGPTTLIDLPWMIFFFAILTLLHYWIGLTALIGGALLVGLTVLTNRVTKEPSARLSMVGAYRNGMAESSLRHAEALTALGMRGRMIDRWSQTNSVFMAAQRSLAESVGTLGGISKIGRMLLQSLILTVGAILVIDGKASGGAIFASSILSARALAPVDQAIATWRPFAAARLGWEHLCTLLSAIPPQPVMPTLLPRPTTQLRAQQLVIAPPGTDRITVANVDFTLNAGDGLAIIGPSAAGKSSLGRALLGIWRPVRGAVRLDGAALDQWPVDHLGSFFGYLPQAVELLEGTVAENIARFEPNPTSESIIAAATAAGVHDMIVALPQGYETPVGFDGRNLSAGQQQRIGLARALYRDPFVVLLDEPNANLDADGDLALENAVAGIRARGGIVIAHRPSALSNVNLILVLRDGRVEGMGPRDEILRQFMARPVPISDTHERAGEPGTGPQAVQGAKA